MVEEIDAINFPHPLNSMYFTIGFEETGDSGTSMGSYRFWLGAPNWEIGQPPYSPSLHNLQLLLIRRVDASNPDPIFYRDQTKQKKR